MKSALRLAPLLLAVALALGTAPIVAQVPPDNVEIEQSADGKRHSKYPAGDAPVTGQPMSWSGVAGAMTNAGINSGVVGAGGFSENVCANLHNAEDETETITIVPVSGDDPAASGWTIGANCSGGSALLANPGTLARSGRMKLRATSVESTDDSGEFDWSFAADPGDDGYQFPDGTTPVASNEELDCVATFHNIGCYWDEPGNNTNNQALMRYRVKNTSTWFEAMPMWFDSRNVQFDETPGNPATGLELEIPYGFDQFRGSILKVQADTIYQIEVLTENSRRIASLEIRTWDETPPEEASPTLTTGTSNAQLTITSGQGGTPTEYQVWRATTANSWIIDRNNAGDGPGGGKQHCISVDAAYVIIDDVRCTDFQDGGIFFGPNAHHVWVINSEFDDFGIDDPLSVFGCNGSSAFLTANADHPNLVGIVIQNNYIHNPKYDSNSWDENGDGTSNNLDNRPVSTNCFLPGSAHPAGSAASDIHDTGGNWVWRYNTFGDAAANFLKLFDDGTSGGQNFSFKGDCPRDCDFYGNFFTHIWDDGHQNEGAGMNNREYENYIQYSRTCSGRAPIAVGPSYVFRNICTKGLFGPAANPANAPPGNNGWFFKCATKPDDGGGLNDVEIGQGFVLIAHNTVYRTQPGNGSDARAQSFQMDDGCGRGMYTYCNIFDTSSSMGSVNRGYWSTAEADGNANIEDNLWGNGQTKPSADATGNTATPAYEAGPHDPNSSDPYEPAVGSAQIDSCDIVLPNLNNVFNGTKADRGAVERGQSQVIYGIR